MRVRRRLNGEDVPAGAVLVLDNISVAGSTDGLAESGLVQRLNAQLKKLAEVKWLHRFVGMKIDDEGKLLLYFEVAGNGHGLRYDKAWPQLIRELVGVVTNVSSLRKQASTVSYQLADGSHWYYNRRTRHSKRSLVHPPS